MDNDNNRMKYRKKKGRDRPKTPFIKLLEDKGKST